MLGSENHGMLEIEVEEEEEKEKNVIYPTMGKFACYRSKQGQQNSQGR